MEGKKRYLYMVAESDSHFAATVGPGSDGDRGRKCRGGGGGHPGRADASGGQADTATFLSRIL
ncbi:hypothetical protein [Methanothrix soehngenii]|uniref:hypothetical protein n=1 Tax=Methanothrix soehngenii TaxID=2223 RepID=UPI0023F12BAA|nr:hypothetical protein [Methanothrix soehngenii]